MALKVAIIGLADSSEEAPWRDADWQKWGLAWDSRWPKFQRTYEIHDIRELDPVYIKDLRHRNALVMQEAYLQVPEATRYPIEEIALSVGDYLCSSISYMLAQAIDEGAQEIGLWGVDMDVNGEYAYQRANTEYLIGLARGRGIKVHIPISSPLCKFSLPSSFKYVGRYGSFS